MVKYTIINTMSEGNGINRSSYRIFQEFTVCLKRSGWKFVNEMSEQEEQEIPGKEKGHKKDILAYSLTWR